MSDREPHAAYRPPRPGPTIRFEPQHEPDDEYVSPDPLFTGTHHLPTFGHSSPLLAQQLPQPIRPITGFGSAATPYKSRLALAREARKAQLERRKATFWRVAGRISRWVLGILAVIVLGFAAWLAFLAWFHAPDERLTPMSSVSPVLALAAGALLAMVLALWLAMVAARMGGRR